jgi:hypothetical protein
MTRGVMMPYSIGFSPRNKKNAKIDVGEAPTAAQALKEVENLIRSDETIRFIKTPDGREIQRWELEELAKKEAKK